MLRKRLFDKFGSSSAGITIKFKDGDIPEHACVLFAFFPHLKNMLKDNTLTFPNLEKKFYNIARYLMYEQPIPKADSQIIDGMKIIEGLNLLVSLDLMNACCENYPFTRHAIQHLCTFTLENLLVLLKKVPEEKIYCFEELQTFWNLLKFHKYAFKIHRLQMMKPLGGSYDYVRLFEMYAKNGESFMCLADTGGEEIVYGEDTQVKQIFLYSPHTTNTMTPLPDVISKIGDRPITAEDVGAKMESTLPLKTAKVLSSYWHFLYRISEQKLALRYQKDLALVIAKCTRLAYEQISLIEETDAPLKKQGAEKIIKDLLTLTESVHPFTWGICVIDGALTLIARNETGKAIESTLLCKYEGGGAWGVQNYDLSDKMLVTHHKMIPAAVVEFCMKNPRKEAEQVTKWIERLVKNQSDLFAFYTDIDRSAFTRNHINTVIAYAKDLPGPKLILGTGPDAQMVLLDLTKGAVVDTFSDARYSKLLANWSKMVPYQFLIGMSIVIDVAKSRNMAEADTNTLMQLWLNYQGFHLLK